MFQEVRSKISSSLCRDIPYVNLGLPIEATEEFVGGLPDFTTLLWVEQCLVMYFVDDQLEAEVVGLFHIVVAVNRPLEEAFHEFDTLGEELRSVEESAGHNAEFWCEDGVYRSR
jgi:hypothetical protein